MKKKGELVLLKEQERKRKKEERIKNDEKDTEDEEHEGMDENAILAHEEATKVKTVLEIGSQHSRLLQSHTIRNLKFVIYLIVIYLVVIYITVIYMTVIYMTLIYLTLDPI